MVFMTGCIPSDDYVFPGLAKAVNIFIIIFVFWVLGTFAEGYEEKNRKKKPERTTFDNKQKRNHIPTHVKREVWRRDQGKCAYCGSQERLEFDHIIPVSKGGSNTARNVQLLCEKCNRSKSNKIE